MHPDIRYHEDPSWPGSGVYQGQKAIQARFQEYADILGPIETTLREFKARRELVVVVFDSRGTSVQTGLPFAHEWAYIWTFREGLLIDWQAYFEKHAAINAVGLEA